MKEHILAINLGSTSTELAIYKGAEELWQEQISHSTAELAKFDRVNEQLPWRQELIIDSLVAAEVEIKELAAIAARGGAGLDALPGGVYSIDEVMVADLKAAKNAEHASNLAGIIAFELSQEYKIPSFVVDPITVDEFPLVARLSGWSKLPRRCQSHALNLKAISRNVAEDLNRELTELRLIGVHLGGGFSIAPIKEGRIIDVNNANQQGPYSPERAGGLPVMQLVDYIYAEEPTKEELQKELIVQGGLASYLGTNSGEEIEERIKDGDAQAELVYQGMIYQLAKEIGAMATVLKGEVDAIFLTGGLANSDYLVQEIIARVGYIAPVRLYPGAEEMKHLAQGVGRVLTKVESAKDYDRARKSFNQRLAEYEQWDIQWR
ncbi:butyrate kinase [Fuchsiella alkaliacetigena]|uniref:butyrate kinase n=1 Tax=Fuchsiella alkaliacetigena TaxID=957042 RepID=UPI00200AE7D9|nr:butyrate kinase [Fuchsiella alkaliacetigena]MCK8824060.1 butyrate kinase [Fuchsiella alkaliacetigena]